MDVQAVPRVNNLRWVHFSLFVLSASMLSFEVVSMRIASVVFVKDYAFIVLSLAILGSGSGGIVWYYSIKPRDDQLKAVFRSLIAVGLSLAFFMLAVIEFAVVNPFIYFLLLFLPFFFSGIVVASLSIIAKRSIFIVAAPALLARCLEYSLVVRQCSHDSTASLFAGYSLPIIYSDGKVS
jgi:hypothetical protein